MGSYYSHNLESDSFSYTNGMLLSHYSKNVVNWREKYSVIVTIDNWILLIKYNEKELSYDLGINIEDPNKACYFDIPKSLSEYITSISILDNHIFIEGKKIKNLSYRLKQFELK